MTDSAGSALNTLSQGVAGVLEIIGAAPIFGAAMITYPIGMLIGIYWTQGLKRSQHKKYVAAKAFSIEHKTPFNPPHKFTTFELQTFSAMLAGHIIGIMTKAFFDAPIDQILAHAVIGGCLAPAAFFLAIKVCEVRNPELAARLKCGDRRKTDDAVTTERREDQDDTGQFWNP